MRPRITRRAAMVAALAAASCSSDRAPPAMPTAAATLGGGAVIVGASDASDRTIGDLGGEASGRQAVTLAHPGDRVTFTLRAADAGADAIVIRFSLPDAPGGGGQQGPLALTARTPGQPDLARTFTLTSRYSWLYGTSAAGTKLYNVPANSVTYDRGSAATHLYDEAQLMLGQPLAAGTTLELALPAGASRPVTVDFLEVEVVAPPASASDGFLSVTDGRCGAIATDTHATGQVFDGIDDTAYASVFHAVIGTNPFNPGSPGVEPAGTQEKDYYSSGSADALQDNAATPSSGGLGMFALADHNFTAFETCVQLAAASPSGIAGVWIPPGRFYVRGALTVPAGLTVRGAGKWYSKLVAVDSEPPTAQSNGSASGIASVSGDLRWVGGANSTGVTLADFSMFGNASQRDGVDHPLPIPVIGSYVNSTFSGLWLEHTNQGIVMNGAASGDTLVGLRARDTFADGMDLFGSTSHTTIDSCRPDREPVVAPG